MSATTTNRPGTCGTCRHYNEYPTCKGAGECKHWSGVTGPSGLSVGTVEEWTCNRWSGEPEAGNPWPTVIEFDEVGDYYGDEGDATSAALDDYFAGYDVPRLVTAEDVKAHSEPGDSSAGDDPTEIIARDGSVYTVGQLREIFDAVSDPDDWKGPIRALIPASGHGVVDAAVEFFTATRISVTDGPEVGTGRILIEADGYRAGPAGDH